MKSKSFVKDKFSQPESGFAKDRELREDFRLVDFEDRAREVLDSAVQQAAQMERQAYEGGFSKGETAGVELGKQKMAPALDRLEEMMKNLADSRKMMLMTMEKKIARLAVEIAEKIVHIAIDKDSEVVKATVAESILESVDRGKIEVRVAPLDYEVIEELRPEILKIDGVDAVTVVSDPDITPGGCRIKTSVGGVDGTVETALKELKTLVD